MDNVSIKKAKLLLHVCCAPCTSVPVERLKEKYDISGFFYNPNIYPENEYRTRLDETADYFNKCNITLRIGSYDREAFYKCVKGLEHMAEGGDRCLQCYTLRIRATAAEADMINARNITTTLTLSPHKQTDMVNAAGREAVSGTHISFLAEDFKKNNGFNRSLDISRSESFYRQHYCGCKYSMQA
ncbi:epoxyqueuosine reductase QueH [Spirochaetota bacterium]